MPRPKIVMVGGGSVNWCPTLIRDMILTEALSDAEFRLLDLDGDAAALIATVGRRYAGEWRLGATFRPMTDMNRAFDGADFVVITISTGGLDAMEHDLKIPEKYGIFQTVGDTVGPGGWARSLRNIPVFVNIAETAARRCPRALILNYTNPLATLTRTLAVTTSQPVVGLCHGVFENFEALKRIFNLKREEDISARYCGVNHFFWILDFAVKGRPGYPMLRRKLRGGKRLDDLIGEAYVDPQGHVSYRRLVASELFEENGYLPYFGDRHIVEFLPRYATVTRATLRKYKVARTSVSERRRWLRSRRRRVELLAAGRRPIERVRSRETAADIIAARLTGAQFVDVMNLPNVGQAANLPPGAVVETPGVVNGLGFSPVACGELPPHIRNMVMPHAINQGLTVEAGLTGDWDAACRALAADPLCSHLSLARVRKMARALLEANRKYLPQFFGRKTAKR